MELALELLLAYWWLIIIVVLLAGYKVVLRLFGVIIIPQDSIGIVDKKFVLVGANRTLPDGRIVALNGEAGIQADTLAPGIHYLKNRVQRQEEARAAISSALDEYNVGAVNTLIGDIAPPEQLMKTLTDRKLAEQERITYGTQREAEEVRKSLQQATAQADTQPGVVRAERDVEIAEFNAKASVKKAEGDAKSKTINADADARVTQLNGDAEAGKIRAIGTSEADVIKLKIASMESGNYALIETAKALAGSGFKLVPDIIAGGDGGQGGSLVSVLLANLVAENVKKNAAG